MASGPRRPAPAGTADGAGPKRPAEPQAPDPPAQGSLPLVCAPPRKARRRPPHAWLAALCLALAVLPALAHSSARLALRPYRVLARYRPRRRRYSRRVAAVSLLPFAAPVAPAILSLPQVPAPPPPPPPAPAPPPPPPFPRPAPAPAPAARPAPTTPRFARPWRVVVPPRMLSVGEARGRVLYSAVRTAGSDGLGHAMSIINADVSAALRLGVAYSHRIGSHGSLTARDAMAVERFFGWGAGALPRAKVFEACGGRAGRAFPPDECPVCLALMHGGRWERGVVERVVDVPLNLSYAFYQTHHSPRARDFAVGAFLRRHDAPNTVFQMPPALCRRSPAQSFFPHDARSHFHFRYWDSRLHDRVHVPLQDAELNIAIHARRGDFFRVRRPMTGVHAFAVAVRQAMGVVRARGGAFARMPVVVRLYSEGEPLGRRPLLNHDVSRMSNRFLGATGVLRGADWVRNAILGGRRDLFRYGLRVDMRIAFNTLDSAHEMIAADMFFGSMSGLSIQVVGSLSRAGVIALPFSPSPEGRWPGHCSIRQDTGEFRDMAQVSSFWAEYAGFYENQAHRAVLDARKRAFSEAPVVPD